MQKRMSYRALSAALLAASLGPQVIPPTPAPVTAVAPAQQTQSEKAPVTPAQQRQIDQALRIFGGSPGRAHGWIGWPGRRAAASLRTAGKVRRMR